MNQEVVSHTHCLYRLAFTSFKMSLTSKNVWVPKTCHRKISHCLRWLSQPYPSYLTTQQLPPSSLLLLPPLPVFEKEVPCTKSLSSACKIGPSLDLKQKGEMEKKRKCGGEEGGGIQHQDTLGHHSPPHFLFFSVSLFSSRCRDDSILDAEDKLLVQGTTCLSCPIDFHLPHTFRAQS